MLITFHCDCLVIASSHQVVIEFYFNIVTDCWLDGWRGVCAYL